MTSPGSDRMRAPSGLMVGTGVAVGAGGGPMVRGATRKRPTAMIRMRRHGRASAGTYGGNALNQVRRACGIAATARMTSSVSPSGGSTRMLERT